MATGKASGQTMGLSLDEAIQRGLRTNLGVILSGTQTAAARGERLSELQALLPGGGLQRQGDITQVDLPARGVAHSGLSQRLSGRSALRICGHR